MKPVGFSLGSNLGDKLASIRTALTLLAAEEGLVIDKISSFYKTEPWGVTDQDWFVNICALGRTSLAAKDLLAITQSIEKQLGRKKSIRWGPRLIDIDILFYGDETIDIPQLTIPHKSIAERAFVLVPLFEIAPHFTLNGKTLDHYINLLPHEELSIIKASK